MQQTGKIARSFLSVEASLRIVSNWLSIAAGIFLIIMISLDVIDVAGRYFFLLPLPGTYELVAFLMIIAGTWGMASAEFSRSHVRVNLVVDKLPRTVRRALDVFAHLIVLIGFTAISSQMFARAIESSYAAGGQKSQTLGLPFSPFYFAFGIGVSFFCLVMLLHLIAIFLETKK
jgi:TRAP-type C4-dicarboxylate transport system permease small subunit